MSLYPTPLGMTRSLARSKGPNLPSVPRLRFRGAPTVSHCTLRGPPSRGAKEQKVTFQLSVSLAQLQLQSILGLGSFRESLDPSEAPRWYR